MQPKTDCDRITSGNREKQANLTDQAPLIGPGLYINASEIDIRFEKQIDFLVNKRSVSLQNHKTIVGYKAAAARVTYVFSTRTVPIAVQRSE